MILREGARGRNPALSPQTLKKRKKWLVKRGRKPRLASPFCGLGGRLEGMAGTSGSCHPLKLLNKTISILLLFLFVPALLLLGLGPILSLRPWLLPGLLPHLALRQHLRLLPYLALGLWLRLLPYLGWGQRSW